MARQPDKWDADLVPCPGRMPAPSDDCEVQVVGCKGHAEQGKMARRERGPEGMTTPRSLVALAPAHTLTPSSSRGADHPISAGTQAGTRANAARKHARNQRPLPSAAHRLAVWYTVLLPHRRAENCRHCPLGANSFPASLFSVLTNSKARLAA